MPPDPIRLADTAAWLSKARLDLRSAAVDLAVSPPIVGDALFHCQQAVEKAIKALLTWHDSPFRKTHDLVSLGGQAVEPDPSLEDLLREAAPLTEYAWKYRYPGEFVEPPPDRVTPILALAKEVVEAIATRIDETSR